MHITVIQAVTYVVLAITLVSQVLYLRSILKRKTIPSQTSRIIWTTLSMVTTIGLYRAHALNGQMAMFAASSLIMFLVSFRYGVFNWGKLEGITMLGAAVSIALLVLSDEPMQSTEFALLTIFIGTIPTYAKTWKNPSSEAAFPWVIVFVACALQVAITPWEFNKMLQPLTYFVIQFVMLLFIFRLRLVSLFDRVTICG